ncbi:MAG: McrC family protein [Planctomycetales bacterium]
MTRSPNVLQLREYEAARIGARWDPDRKIIPIHVVMELERLQSLQRREFFQISRQRVKAKNFVGVVGVGDLAVEVLPKTDDETVSARRRLVEMLSVAGFVPHLDAGVAELTKSTPCLLDAFMQAYVRQLALEWRRGRIADYQRTDANRTCLRGKLLFSEQLRRNRLRPERFFTRADEFLADVPPARLLKAGLQVCRRHGVSDSTRRTATSLIPEFDDVSDWTFTDAELDGVQADRKIARFEPLLTLAKRFVRGCVPDRPGGAATFSLLFDMNVVFERYIGNLLRRACPPACRAQLQVSGRSLVLRGGKARFGLVPDAAIRRGNEFSCLIDTKWKVLRPNKTHAGVLQADMYQAYAYAKEFDCPSVILLFPQNAGLPQRVADYRLNPGDETSPRIDVRAIDVTATRAAVVRQLREIIGEAMSAGTSVRTNEYQTP